MGLALLVSLPGRECMKEEAADWGTGNKYHLVEGGEWCQKIVDDAGIPTLDDFYKWNPAVGVSISSYGIQAWTNG